jgi:hypothetical protein
MKKLFMLLVVASLLGVSTIQAKAADKGILSIVGPIVSIPVGAGAGLLRGTITGGTHYADTVSDGIGGGVIGKLIGVPTGLVLGGVTGGVTGTVKGVVDGLVLGVEHPLTSKSMSLDGDFMDFDSYTILNL